MKDEIIPVTKKSGDVDVPGRLLTLNKKERHAALATHSGRQPYTSLVAFALTPDGGGVLFATPRKTTKYKNIMRNKNVALLIDTRTNSPKGYMDSEAVTILGKAAPIRKGKRRDELAGIFISKHQQLAEFVNAPSTAMVFVSIQKVIHAGRFQRVTEWTHKDV